MAWLSTRQTQGGGGSDALRHAIAVLEAVPGRPFADQTLELRFELGAYLRNAGDQQGAEIILANVFAAIKDRKDIDWFQRAMISQVASTKEMPVGLDMLNNYLVSHPNLSPRDESGLLLTMSAIAGKGGDSKRADEYRLAGDEKHRLAEALITPPASSPATADDAQKAQALAKDGKFDEAVALAKRVITAAPRARDRGQVVSMMYFLSETPLLKNSPGPMDELYGSLLAAIPAWPGLNMTYLLSAKEGYVRFLQKQEDRRTEVPAALKQYRETVIAAHGAGTGHMDKPLNLVVQSWYASASEKKAAAEELLALEESLSGSKSGYYLPAAESLAGMIESSDPKRAAQLRLRAVLIADLLTDPKNEQRAWVRRRSAISLAKMGQFEDAERLANEAAEIGRLSKSSQQIDFERLPEEIRKMKLDYHPKPPG